MTEPCPGCRAPHNSFTHRATCLTGASEPRQWIGTQTPQVAPETDETVEAAHRANRPRFDSPIDRQGLTPEQVAKGLEARKARLEDQAHAEYMKKLHAGEAAVDRAWERFVP